MQKTKKVEKVEKQLINLLVLLWRLEALSFQATTPDGTFEMRENGTEDTVIVGKFPKNPNWKFPEIWTETINYQVLSNKSSCILSAAGGWIKVECGSITLFWLYM